MVYRNRLMGHPVPGGNKYRNLALQVEGVSKIETIKYVHESRLLVREGAAQQ
jgi:hypothetical protein